MAADQRVPGDSPIRTSGDDLLGRDQGAADFADHILALDPLEGLVVGVLGPWGAGKTSFVNLTRQHIAEREVPLVDFNPWMFSGADQLVQSFFIELASQLKLRSGLGEIAEGLEDYGEAFAGLGWLPIAGPWIERARGGSKLLAKLLQRRKEGIGGRRERIAKALQGLDKPIVVVVDDIDRLTSAEIRDIFKLIRLTASFPNVIYVVAFDRERVEQALGEDGVPGRAYLEKILQVAIDLPAVPDQVLSSQVLRAIDEALVGLKTTELDQATWQDVYAEVVWPLVANMRDVRRFAAAVHGTVRRLGDGVAIADVLGLEAIRVFLPDVYRLLPSSVGALTEPYVFVPRQPAEAPHLKAQIDRIVKAGGDDGGVVVAMIHRLFLAGARHFDDGMNYGPDWQAKWLRHRRVAHPDILRLYLEGVGGESLIAFGHAEQLYERIADQQAFSGYLDQVPSDQLGDVITSLEIYENAYQADHVVPASIVLLNAMPRLPEKPRSLMSNPFGQRMLVKRVVLRLLRTLADDPTAVEAVVKRILPEVQSLSSQLDLITLVGHQENAGHQLIAEEAAGELEYEWRGRVRAASVDQLVEEKELLMVLFRTIDGSADGEEALAISPEPRMTLAVLNSARTEVIGQSIGSRATSRSNRLHWDIVAGMYPDEDVLQERVERLRQSELSAEAIDLIELTEKYLSGWRPREF